MARSGTVARYDNGWGYRVELLPDPATGKRRQRWKQGYRTKREAEDALKACIAETQHGPIVDRSTSTLGEYLDEWIELQTDRLRPSTLHSYRIVVARLKAHAGRVKLQALTPMEIEKLYKTMGESGGHDGRPLAAKTVKNTHVVLRKALADAERVGLVQRNAAGAARAPSLRKVERETWTSEQLREFLIAMKGHRLRAAFVVLGTTGMRRGEVLGLRWRDIDFDAGELSVANTLTTAGFGTVVAGPPKTTKSRRHLFLDSKTLEVLRDHRRSQREERLAAGPAWNGGNDYTFTDELGNPLHPDQFSLRFRQCVKRSGLPMIRLHDLRHSYATLALKAGVHPKVVSERLGHAGVGITLDLYSHVTRSIARDAADAVGLAVVD
jgi:integrase